MFNAIHRRRGQKGFTLIELLIVVAIIGIIAAILIPNLLDALQKAKQKRTVGDIRAVGAAWFSWLTDQVGAAAAGADNTYNYSGLTTPVAATALLNTLFLNTSMFYIQVVPTNDLVRSNPVESSLALGAVLGAAVGRTEAAMVVGAALAGVACATLSNHANRSRARCGAVHGPGPSGVPAAREAFLLRVLDDGRLRRHPRTSGRGG